jgi:hypothetical protein
MPLMLRDVAQDADQAHQTSERRRDKKESRAAEAFWPTGME